MLRGKLPFEVKLHVFIFFLDFRVAIVVNPICFCFSIFADNTAEKQGAFLTFRLRVEFSGTNVFSRNEKGAMLIFQTKVGVGGSLMFQGNTAKEGGAVILEDQSWVNHDNFNSHYIYYLSLFVVQSA